MHALSRYVLGSFFFGLIAAAAVYAGYAVVTQLPMALASDQWPTVEGKVEVSTAYRRRKGRARRHRLIYSYIVNDHYYDGRRVTFMGAVFRGNPQEMAQRYRSGDPVTVYYHPANPSVSVLEPVVWWLGFAVASIAAVVFGVFGFLGLRATFR